MSEKLTRLYNTMLNIETKGASTKTMADCLRFLEKMIEEEQSVPKSIPSEDES